MQRGLWGMAVLRTVSKIWLLKPILGKPVNHSWVVQFVFVMNGVEHVTQLTILDFAVSI